MPPVAQPSPDLPGDDDGGGELGDLPLDPDLETAEDARHHPAATPPGPFARERRRRWPRVRWTSVAAVAVGAFFGGVARYAVGLAWPTPSGTFPWAIFLVNTVGAFVLALVLVLILEVLPPTTYLRPALGTGFCGALTTFSSVATAVDQLAAHGHGKLAAGYLSASVTAGLAAVSFGMIVGRSIAAAREKGKR